MKILFIGGSNTVIRNGYSNCLTDLLVKSGISRDQISNFAVGANSSVHGLQVLKTVINLSDVEILFIEYCINDFELISKSGDAIWFGSVEGIVRFALSCNPSMQIKFIMLGRRKDSYWQKKIHNNIKRIASYYGERHNVGYIDVDMHLKERAISTNTDYTAYFSDNVHYKTTNVTDIIANYIMENIDLSINLKVGDIPDPLMANNFEGAIVFAAQQIISDKEIIIMGNSRFKESVVAIKLGDSVKITLPGPIISIAFCSASEACRASIEEEGEIPVLFETLHEAVNQGAFQFLIKTVPFKWKRWATAVHVPREINIRAITTDSIPDDVRFVPGQSMIASERDAGAFFLSHIMSFAPPPSR